MPTPPSPYQWSVVHTDPGTLAGAYRPRVWQPIAESARLAAGQARPLPDASNRAPSS